MHKGDAWYMKLYADLDQATHSQTVDWVVPRTLTQQAKRIWANLDSSITTWEHCVPALKCFLKLFFLSSNTGLLTSLNT